MAGRVTINAEMLLIMTKPSLKGKSMAPGGKAPHVLCIPNGGSVKVSPQTARPGAQGNILKCGQSIPPCKQDGVLSWLPLLTHRLKNKTRASGNNPRSSWGNYPDGRHMDAVSDTGGQVAGLFC